MAININVKSFIEKFEQLQQKKVSYQTEKQLLEAEEKRLLQELQLSNIKDLQKEIQKLEEQLNEKIAELNIPEEYKNELTTDR